MDRDHQSHPYGRGSLEPPADARAAVGGADTACEVMR